MTYRGYKVESVELNGAIVNVNGTSITDCKKMDLLMNNPYGNGGFTVFVDSDEVCFNTFKEAYEFAMTKQKDTFRI